MYEVSNEVRENLVEQVERVLNERNYPYNHRVIKDIVNNAIEAKSSLIDLLSKHPKWNPEKLMIQFDEDYSREFNRRAIWNFTRWLEIAIHNEKGCIPELDRNVLTFIDTIKEQFFSPEMDRDINWINEENDNFKLRNNMKSSKAIMKLCVEMGFDKLPPTGELPNSTPERPKYDSFNYRYAMLCDNINPIKTTRHTCLSLNPVDFLLMSYGTSWQSCHYIDYFDDDPGCYSSGTISYMLDECSFIFYTVDASFDGKDIELEPKIQRQVFGYNDEVFVQSRLYPQSMDEGAEAIYTDIRNVVQKVIADCLEKPNLWKKTTSDVLDYVEKGDDATCYPDWEPGCPGSSHCSISKLKGSNKFPKIILGKAPICIECGYEHDTDKSITCCSTPGGERCVRCGDIISRNDVRWIDDDPYCSECTYCCEDCEEYIAVGDEYEVKYYLGGRVYTKYICGDCKRDYSRCDCCGAYWHDDDMATTEEGGWYCPNCEDSWNYCGKCEECHDVDYMTWDDEDGCYYCNDCYNEIMNDRNEEDEDYDEAI